MRTRRKLQNANTSHPGFNRGATELPLSIKADYPRFFTEQLRDFSSSVRAKAMPEIGHRMQSSGIPILRN